MNAGAPLGRSVRVEAVSKSFRLKRGASVQAIKRVDLEIAEGEFVAQGSPVRVLRSEGYRHVVRSVG